MDETRVVEEITGEQGHEEWMRSLVVDEVMGSGRGLTDWCYNFRVAWMCFRVYAVQVQIKLTQNMLLKQLNQLSQIRQLLPTRSEQFTSSRTPHAWLQLPANTALDYRPGFYSCLQVQN